MSRVVDSTPGNERSADHRAPGVSRWSLLALLVLVLVGTLATSSADARTRLVCRWVVDNPWPIPDVVVYPGHSISCGRHLQPSCSSAPACDAGFSSYSGSPFPYTYDCPSPVPSSANPTFSSGCYEDVPDCNACGFDGQPGCPVEAEPWCGIVGCRNGLEPDPLTTLCADPIQPGDACGPAAPCPDGLVCDPFAGFRCVEIAQAGDSCANPFVQCDTGLQCTLALECSHEPARAGETCDATAPCGNGLFCQAGIPQRCQRYARVGEPCDLLNPCIPGALCESCNSDYCEASRLCYWDGRLGLNDMQCAALYDEGTAAAAQSIDQTLTFSSGFGVSVGTSLSRAAGVAYGGDGSYGCFTTDCRGFEFDAAVDFFVAVGRYDDFSSVGGGSAEVVTDVQIPGSLLTYSKAQSFDNFASYPGFSPGPVVVGEEHAFAVGLGVLPSPISAGFYSCTSTLSVLVDGSTGGGGPPPPPPPPAERPGNLVANAHFNVDTAGWSCESGGTCSWREDDPRASTVSGSGSVESPATDSPVGGLVSACLPADEGILYELSAAARTSGPVPGSLVALWSSSETCAGGAILNESIAVIPNDGQWSDITRFRPAPAGAVAVSFKAIAARNAEGVVSTTQIDEVYVPEPGSMVRGKVALLLFALIASIGSRVRHCSRALRPR